MTDEQTAGTPPKDDGDAAAQSPTTGTPNGDGRDAASGETDYKALYLASKDKIEEANRLRAEVEALRARADQPPADQDDDEDAATDGSDGVDWTKVQDFASRGDEVAKAQIANRRMQIELAKNVRDSFQLRDIEDKTERKEVLAHFARNRNRLGDIQAAKAEVRERKLDAENERLRKELEAAKKQPPTDVVRTHDREITSSGVKARKMTYEEFDREQAQLKAAGKFKEAMARQSQLAKGEIETPD